MEAQTSTPFPDNDTPTQTTPGVGGSTLNDGIWAAMCARNQWDPALRRLVDSEHGYSGRAFWMHHASTQAARIAIRTTTDRPRNVEREALKAEVYDLLKEAGTENWDGEGALALGIDTVAVAQKLVDKLPSHVRKPDVAATPHGEVDFDWVINSDVMLTVSVGPLNEIAFAGFFRGARLNGREPWTGILPQFVNCCFERLRDSLDR